MDIICKVLVIFATIDLVFFAIEEGRRIYRRYQAKKDLEAFAEWARKRLEERQEDKKEEGCKQYPARFCKNGRKN